MFEHAYNSSFWLTPSQHVETRKDFRGGKKSDRADDIVRGWTF